MTLWELLESLDAEILTGDVLFSDIEKIKEYIERWSRAIKDHELIEEESPELPESEALFVDEYPEYYDEDGNRIESK